MSRQHFEAVRASAHYWVEHASVLHCAAVAVWAHYDGSIAKYRAEADARGERDWVGDMLDHSPRVFTVSFLLIGAAIENLLKAKLLWDDADTPLERFGHNLPGLAEAARLELDERQRRLLSALREAIEWRGKYPAPKLQSRRALPSVDEPLGPEDWPDILRLYHACVLAVEEAEDHALRDEDGSGDWR